MPLYPQCLTLLYLVFSQLLFVVEVSSSDIECRCYTNIYTRVINHSAVVRCLNQSVLDLSPLKEQASKPLRYSNF